MLLGDINAHHVEWNCNSSDKNGESRLQLFEKHEINIHNTKSYFNITNNSRNNLDLVQSDYRVTDISTLLHEGDPLGSDHFPICISLNTEKAIYKKKSNKVSSIKTNWSTYRDLMNRHYETLVQDFKGTAIDKYHRLVNIMKESVSICTPRRNVSKQFHRNPVPWWDIDCDKYIRLRKAAFKK